MLPANFFDKSDEHYSDYKKFSDYQSAAFRQSKQKNSRCTDWTFTLNNFSVLEYRALCKLGESDLVSYMKFQGECGSKNSTPHLQGFVQFTNRVTFKSLRNMFPRAHWEKRRGRPAAAAGYIADFEEDGSKKYYPELCERFEVGELDETTQGKRTDLEDIYESLKADVSMLEIMEKYPGTYIRCRQNILNTKVDLKMAKARRATPINVIILWGDAWSGKSRMAQELCKEACKEKESYVSLTPKLTDYKQQNFPRVIYMEEFSGSDLTMSEFKRYFDPNASQVTINQRNVDYPFLVEFCVITSQYNPATWWQKANDQDQMAIYRRITRCIQFKGVYGELGHSTLELACGQKHLPKWWVEARKGSESASAAHFRE